LLVDKRDKKFLRDLVTFIRERHTSEIERTNIYFYLLKTRGEAAALHARSLVRGYGGTEDFRDLQSECEAVFTEYISSKAMSHDAKVCIAALIALVILPVGLMVSSILHHSLARDQRYLVLLAVAALVGALVYGGAGTAMVDVKIPVTGKAAIKYGGAAAAVVGVLLTGHFMGWDTDSQIKTPTTSSAAQSAS